MIFTGNLYIKKKNSAKSIVDIKYHKLNLLAKNLWPLFFFENVEKGLTLLFRACAAPLGFAEEKKALNKGLTAKVPNLLFNFNFWGVPLEINKKYADNTAIKNATAIMRITDNPSPSGETQGLL